MTTIVGGTVGDSIAQELTQRKVHHYLIRTATPTRVCTTMVSEADGVITELVENAGAISEAELAEYVATYKDRVGSCDVVVLTGSLPAGVPHTFYRELLELSSCPVVMDARGPELEAALDREPFLVKPNRDELARTVGRELIDEADLLSAMDEIVQRGAKWVLVSDGSHPLRLTNGDDCYRVHPPSVPVRNPIGCGDCLAAGLAWSISRGLSVPEAARYGVAAAVVNLQQLLPAQLNREAVEELAAAVTVEPVN